MTPAKRKTATSHDDVYDETRPRLGPLDYEVQSIAPGSWSYPGGVHHLGDHEFHLVEGDAGDWHTFAMHPGYEYRDWLCECGFSSAEGREAADTAPVSPFGTATEFPGPAEATGEAPGTPDAEPAGEAPQEAE